MEPKNTPPPAPLASALSPPNPFPRYPTLHSLLIIFSFPLFETHVLYFHRASSFLACRSNKSRDFCWCLFGSENVPFEKKWVPPIFGSKTSWHREQTKYRCMWECILIVKLKNCLSGPRSLKRNQGTGDKLEKKPFNATETHFYAQKHTENNVMSRREMLQ